MLKMNMRSPQDVLVSNIIPNITQLLLTRPSYNLTTRSGKPTTIRAKEPVSAIIRLGETIFWSRATLRFSFGSCSFDSIWGRDTSAVMVGVRDQMGHEWKGNVHITPRETKK